MPFIFECAQFQDAFSKEDPSVSQIVHKRLNTLRGRKKLVPSATLRVYDRAGIFIQRFTGQGTNMRVIIQEHKFQSNEQEHTIYLLREYISQNRYEPRWRNNVLPHIESGSYKEEYPLDQEELRQAEDSYLSTISRKKEVLPPPPKDITDWFLEDGFSINPEFSIYETQDWMTFSSDYMQDYASDFFRLLQAIYKEDEGGIEYEIVEEIANDRNLKIAYYEEVYLIYEECLDEKDERIFLLHNGGITTGETPEKKTKKVQAALQYEPLQGIKGGEYSIEKLSKGAVRAYPSSIVSLTGKRKEWKEIQTHSNKSNLALSPEQLKLLKNYSFPKFINGQAGSGKSEMLYYLFAEILFRRSVYDFEGNIIFLTENEELLKKALYDTRSKLQSNSHYQGAELDSLDINRFFYPFRRFLLENLVEDQNLYPKNKYVNFAKFKTLYENGRIPTHTVKRYPAEIAWFIIYSFIKGQDATVEEFTPEDFENLYSKDKNGVDRETYEGVFNEIWKPFYKKLREKGYWDQLDLVRDILQSYDSIPEYQKYTAILCDEAQDFTRVELQLLIRLSRFTDYNQATLDQIPITFAGDPFQTVNPTGFSLEKLKRLFDKELSDELNFSFSKELIADLFYNYRSSKKIVDFANAIQYFRRFFLKTTDLRYPQEAKRLGNAPTPMIFCTKKDERVLKEKLGAGVVFILGCNDGEEEALVEADGWLEPSFIVKSAARSKGSEYPSVAIYNFGEQFIEEFSPNLLQQILDGEKTFDSLSSGQQFKIAFFFNKLYVAVTRAQEECFILDTRKGIENFWEVLRALSETKIKDPKWQGVIASRFIEHGNLETLHNTDKMNVLKIAEEDRANGLAYEDSDKLLDAAKAYSQLGPKYEHDVIFCQAKALQFGQNYREAGDKFKEIGYTEDASTCYWIGQYWQELLALHKAETGRKPIVRSYIASIMSGSLVDTQPVADYGKTILTALDEPECKGKIIWREDFITKLSALVLSWAGELSTDEAKVLAEKLDTFELPDNSFLDALAHLHLKAEQYSRAVACWELSDDYGHVYYYQAKLYSTINPVERVIYFNELGKTEEVVNEFLNAKDQFAEIPEKKIVLKALNKSGRITEAVGLAYSDRELWPHFLDLVLAKNEPIAKMVLLLSTVIELADKDSRNRSAILSADFLEKVAGKLVKSIPLKNYKPGKEHKLKKLADESFASSNVVEAARLFTKAAARSQPSREKLSSNEAYLLVRALARQALSDRVDVSAIEWACAIERTHSKHIEAVKLFDGHKGFLLLDPELDQDTSLILLNRWMKIQLKRALMDWKQPSNQKVDSLKPELKKTLTDLLLDNLASLKRKGVAIASEYTFDLKEIDRLPFLPDYYTLTESGNTPAIDITADTEAMENAATGETIGEEKQPLFSENTDNQELSAVQAGQPEQAVETGESIFETPLEVESNGIVENGEKGSDQIEEEEEEEEEVEEKQQSPLDAHPVKVDMPLQENGTEPAEPQPEVEIVRDPNLIGRISKLEEMLLQVMQQQESLARQVQELNGSPHEPSRNEKDKSLLEENSQLWRELSQLQQKYIALLEK
ncbi:MAG: hypothetical protein H6573_32055 [Lewinellaceae bacterium]|nr:hypothetical protein [Lewinellaceae bacterium]